MIPLDTGPTLAWYIMTDYSKTRPSYTVTIPDIEKYLSCHLLRVLRMGEHIWLQYKNRSHITRPCQSHILSWVYYSELLFSLILFYYNNITLRLVLPLKIWIISEYINPCQTCCSLHLCIKSSLFRCIFHKLLIWNHNVMVYPVEWHSSIWFRPHDNYM